MGRIVRLTESDVTRLVRRVIKESVEGDVQQMLMACSKDATLNPGLGNVTQKARALYQAMKEGAFFGAGTEEEAVYKVIDGLKDGDDVCAVKTEYRRAYGETLFDHIKGEFSGEEKDYLMQKLKNKLSKQRHTVHTR